MKLRNNNKIMILLPRSIHFNFLNQSTEWLYTRMTIVIFNIISHNY